jgi:hypothetical protein
MRRKRSNGRDENRQTAVRRSALALSWAGRAAWPNVRKGAQSEHSAKAALGHDEAFALD